MSRPLIVTDCDEVLLHMVRHFRDWLGEAHDIEFPLDANPFASMRRRGELEPLPDAEKWRAIQDEEVEVRLHRPSGSVLIKIPGVAKPLILPALCPPSLAL